MTFVDHIFLFLLLVVQPWYGARSFKQYISEINAGAPANRIKLYNQTIILEWVAVAILGAVWIFYGRSAESLGFTPLHADQPLWWGLGAVAAVCGYLVFTRGRVRRMSTSEKQEQLDSLGELVHFLPQTKPELRRFSWTSLTAGICEEIIFRGFLLWYLSQIMPVWAAVVVSSIIFGLAHTYQGFSGVIRVFAIGLGFGVLYAATGSIWIPIVAHILVDVLQGWIIAALYEDEEKLENAAT